MSACNVEVIKMIGKYLNVPVGTVCYNSEKVLTTVLNKQNVEGFATIVMRLAQSGVQMSREQSLLCYQWLEHISMYANQAATNPVFAKGFLQDINRALRINTYLTGQVLTIADVAAYHVLYPLLTATFQLQHMLPRQIYPHELRNMSMDKPIVYRPQPFAFPGYPVILYL